MRTRLMLVSSVTGAVVVGGAVTGTTLALWQDSHALSDVTVRSGSIGLAVAAGSAAGHLVPGGSQTTPLTLTNTRSAAQGGVPVAVRLSSATAPAGPLAAAVLVRVSAGACPASPAAATQPLAGYTTQELGGPLPAGETAAACLTVSLPPDADTASGGSTLQGSSAQLTLVFTGTQVRS